ncbi:tape measure domain-containing protein [Thermanaeromonas toyohensis ToBE]|uniref:Tape measure domain-containing protein n=1 Tax=Thermanaeromonas toyohensis ToBE TaxID=698762 RepID=A0A1W1VX30_9FIRM|nr:tape measure protein [Thermanaeromonas toyohensis]SMB97939.1 tape measure domain-containing protein [Thermanaeromonas toyohensis ToBE]
MAEQAGEVVVVIRADDEQLRNAMAATKKRVDQVVQQMERHKNIVMTAKLVDRVSGPLRTIGDKLNRLSGVHTIMFRAVDRVMAPVKKTVDLLTSPLALLGAGAGFAGLIGYPLKLAGEIEQANIAMETLLGSSEKAQEFIGNLADFAAKTPFEMPQLLEASRRLLAFGFGAEKIIPMLNAAGNAAAGLGLGAEGINRIIIALGQMKAKAKVSAEEMMQLTEAGVPAWDILAKAMGVTTAQAMKLSEKGLIPAEQAIEALVKGMEERFPNMMEKQSRSLFGLLSTLKDYANLKFFWAFGEGLRQAVVPAMQRFVDMLTQNESGLKRVQGALMQVGTTLGNWIINSFSNFYSWLERLASDETFRQLDFWGKLKFVLDEATAKLNEWLAGPGGQLLSTAGQMMVEIIARGLEIMAPRISEAAVKIGSKIATGILAEFGNRLKSSPFGALIMGALGGAAIGSIVPGIGTGLGGLIGGGAGILTYFASKLFGEPPEVLYPEAEWPAGYAKGALVRTPHIAVVGEEGPEVIIPLSGRHRRRALALWEEAGRFLGVKPYAYGGIVGLPGVVSAGSNVNVSVGGITVNLTSAEINTDELALQIGRQIVARIKRVLENSG